MTTISWNKTIYLILLSLFFIEQTATSTNVPNFDRLLAELTVVEPKVNAILSNQQAYNRAELRQIIYNVNNFCEKLRDTVSSIDNHVYNNIFDTLALTISSPECDNNKIMDDLLSHYDLAPTSINRCKFSITMINKIARYVRSHQTILHHDYPTLCDSIITALNVTAAEIKDISVWMDNQKNVKEKKWLNKRNLTYLFGLLSVTLTIAVGIGGYFYVKNRLAQTLASAQEHAVQQSNLVMQKTNQQVQTLNRNITQVSSQVADLRNQSAQTITNVTQLQNKQAAITQTQLQLTKDAQTIKDFVEQQVNTNTRVIAQATNAFQEEAQKQHEALERQHNEVNRVFEKMGSVAQEIMHDAPQPRGFLNWLTNPLNITKPAQFTQLISSLGTLVGIGTQVIGAVDSVTRNDEQIGYSPQDQRLYERLQNLRPEHTRPPISVYGR